jgi:hypothetical protein
MFSLNFLTHFLSVPSQLYVPPMQFITLLIPGDLYKNEVPPPISSYTASVTDIILSLLFSDTYSHCLSFKDTMVHNQTKQPVSYCTSCKPFFIPSLYTIYKARPLRLIVILLHSNLRRKLNRHLLWILAIRRSNFSYTFSVSFHGQTW